MSTPLFLPLLPLEGILSSRHLPVKITHAKSRRQLVQEFEHDVKHDIQSRTRHGEEGGEDEFVAMGRELHQWEGVTTREKERWVKFKEHGA